MKPGQKINQSVARPGLDSTRHSQGNKSKTKFQNKQTSGNAGGRRAQSVQRSYDQQFHAQNVEHYPEERYQVDQNQNSQQEQFFIRRKSSKSLLDNRQRSNMRNGNIGQSEERMPIPQSYSIKRGIYLASNGGVPQQIESPLNQRGSSNPAVRKKGSGNSFVQPSPNRAAAVGASNGRAPISQILQNNSNNVGGGNQAVQIKNHNYYSEQSQQKPNLKAISPTGKYNMPMVNNTGTKIKDYSGGNGGQFTTKNEGRIGGDKGNRSSSVTGGGGGVAAHKVTNSTEMTSANPHIATHQATNEDSLNMSNMFRISTMGGTIGRANKSLTNQDEFNFSNNASLIKGLNMSALTANMLDDDSLEDLHYCMVAFQQKSKMLLTKVDFSSIANKTQDLVLPELQSTPQKTQNKSGQGNTLTGIVGVNKCEVEQVIQFLEEEENL